MIFILRQQVDKGPLEQGNKLNMFKENIGEGLKKRASFRE